MADLCNLCPRKCNTDRSIRTGVCGADLNMHIARADLHKWEEPCISVTNGAGTIFFSGCNLHCCYCQNNVISKKVVGKQISISELADIMLELQNKGADNIELVTPTHYISQILKALDIAKPKLNIPIVYNTGGYELAETIKMLDGYIDVYIPDLKYFSSEISKKYSTAHDYFEYATTAILEMINQRGKLKFSENGALLSGTIIRHLVLPSCRHDSFKIIDWIAENVSSDSAIISLMSQYTPFDFISDEYRELKRKLTKMEYNSVVKYASEKGIEGYTQQFSSATSDYLPDFDLI